MIKGKTKIQKNRSDAEMMAGFEEEITFENYREESSGYDQPSFSAKKKNPAQDESSSFFTPELQAQVSQELLKIKLNLYQKGILDYRLEMKAEGNQVILTAVPVIKSKKNKR